MRTRYALLALTASMLFPISAIDAQSAIPSDIRSKMSGYVGTWNFEERLKETPTSPETTSTGTWEARWIFDSLIEWKGTNISGGQTSTNVEYEGYDPVKQGYTYWFVSDGSRGQSYDGEWDGNTLRLQTISYAANGTVIRGRCTWPYSADFTALNEYFCEQLTDGRWWVSRRGKATKVGG